MIDVWEMQIRGFKDAKLAKSKWRLSPIVPMVFYTGRRKWPGKIGLASMMDLPTDLAEYLPQWETLFLQLRSLDARILMDAATPIAAILRALQTVEEPKEAWANVLSLVVRRLDALPESEQAQWRRAMQYLYMLVRHKRDSSEQDDLFSAMDEAVEQHLNEIGEVEMTGAQALIEKGRQEGKQEGKLEGLHESVLKLISARFGNVTAETAAKVRTLTESQLDAAFARILAARTLEEVEL